MGDGWGTDGRTGWAGLGWAVGRRKTTRKPASQACYCRFWSYFGGGGVVVGFYALGYLPFFILLLMTDMLFVVIDDFLFLLLFLCFMPIADHHQLHHHQATMIKHRGGHKVSTIPP